jgi:uncharacterized membrane protein YqjE
MTNTGEPRRESIFGLVRDLVGGVVTLARLELTRGRQEMAEMLGETRSGLLMIGIAVGLVLLALIALVSFLVLGLAALTGLPAWLVALLVVVALSLIAALLGYRGVRKIHIGPPQETIASVKEDVAWARRLLRRE